MIMQFRLAAFLAAMLIYAAQTGQSVAQELSNTAKPSVAGESADEVELEIPSASETPHKVSPIGRRTMTGSWGGERIRLHERGITLWGGYVSETFGVPGGGLRKGTAYTQQLNAGIDLDMERIAGWGGAKFHFILNDRRGDSASGDFIGNFFNVQEVYGFQWTKISEISYEQNLADGNANLRIGFFPIGNDFGVVAGSCNFVNVALCAHPKNFAGGSGWTGYPFATWGAKAKVNVRSDITVQVGAFQVVPTVIEKRYAFNPFGGDTTGVIMPFEVEYAPGRVDGFKGLTSSYKIGFYYDTSNAPRMGGPGEVGDRYGVYANASQVIARTGENGRNLSGIGYVAFNPKSGAQFTQWYMAGLIKTGTFMGRDRDTFGVAFIRSVINPRLRNSHRVPSTGPMPGANPPIGESVAEIAYGAQIRQWLIARPSLQIILDPGALSYQNRPTATAAGLQIKAQF